MCTWTPPPCSRCRTAVHEQRSGSSPAHAVLEGWLEARRSRRRRLAGQPAASGPETGQISGREAPSLGYDWSMSLLVGIVNLVVLLFIIEAWVNGRIPGALAKAAAERVDERLNDPANPTSARLDRLGRGTDDVGIRLDRVDRRLDEVDTRLDALDHRLGGLDARLDALDNRMSDLDTRLDRVDARLDRVDAQVAVLNAQTSQQISDLDRRVRERLRALHSRTSTPEDADSA